MVRADLSDGVVFDTDSMEEEMNVVGTVLDDEGLMFCPERSSRREKPDEHDGEENVVSFHLPLALSVCNYGQVTSEALMTSTYQITLQGPVQSRE